MRKLFVILFLLWATTAFAGPPGSPPSSGGISGSEVPANETDPIAGAINGLVEGDGAGNLSAASSITLPVVLGAGSESTTAGQEGTTSDYQFFTIGTGAGTNYFPSGASKDDVRLGDGTDTDKTITIDNGDSPAPVLTYDATGELAGTGAWTASNDGASAYPLTNKYLGKTIIWEGDSTGEENTGGHTFPEYVGILLGATIDNQSTGGAHWYFSDYDDDCGTLSGAEVRSFAATYRELQAKIDAAGATSSYHANCQTAASILSQSYMNKMLHKAGDVYVFGLAINDRHATRNNGVGVLDTTKVTISNIAGSSDNTDCTAADTPWDCCTGSGTGTCYIVTIDTSAVHGLSQYDDISITERGDSTGYNNLTDEVRSVTDTDTFTIIADSTGHSFSDCTGCTNAHLESFDKSTVLGAAQYSLRALAYDNPDAEVVILPSYINVFGYDTSIDGLTQRDPMEWTNQGLARLAHKTNNSFYNLNAVMGINAYTVDDRLPSDGTHPTTLAEKQVIARELAGAMMAGPVDNFTPIYQLGDTYYVPEGVTLTGANGSPLLFQGGASIGPSGVITAHNIIASSTTDYPGFQQKSTLSGAHTWLTASNGNKWYVYDADGTTYPFLISNGSLNGAIQIGPNGVRIGSTTAPTVPLDVTGAALFSSTVGITGALDAKGAISNSTGPVNVSDMLQLAGYTSDPCPGGSYTNTVFFNTNASPSRLCICDSAGDDIAVEDGSSCF